MYLVISPRSLLESFVKHTDPYIRKRRREEKKRKKEREGSGQWRVLLPDSDFWAFTRPTHSRLRRQLSTIVHAQTLTIFVIHTLNQRQLLEKQPRPRP